MNISKITENWDSADEFLQSQIDTHTEDIKNTNPVYTDISSAIVEDLSCGEHIFHGGTCDVVYADMHRSEHYIDIELCIKGTISSRTKSSKYAEILRMPEIKPKHRVFGVAYTTMVNSLLSTIDSNGTLFVSHASSNLSDISDDAEVFISIHYAI